MKKTIMAFMAFVAVAGAMLLAVPTKAHAYPGFARKYNFPCSFCHIQWPKLADTGNMFKDRGFMLSTTGKANGLDMMFQQPGNQNYFPIGFHMSMAYEGTAINGVASGPNFAAPNTATAGGNWYNTGTATVACATGSTGCQNTSHSLNGAASAGPFGNNGFAAGANSNTIWDIESGGLLAPWISFWVQPGAGGGAPALGIVKLWVRFDDLFNTQWMNLYVGVTSQDVPFSNQRALQIGGGAPYTMFDYQPGTPEVTNNNNGNVANWGPANLSAFFDADALRMLNDHPAIRYFGYHFENGCGTMKSFSIDPCETRLSVSFIPNAGLYGGNQGDWSNTPNGASPPGYGASNGFSYFLHATQSFGGWGATNGERIGAFAYIGEASSAFTGAGASSPNTVYNRVGIDIATNPIPNGGLNIFGAAEIVNDPAGAIISNPAVLATAGTGSGLAATSGLEYATWFVEADWQPTFGGFFSAGGTNSNMILFTYNQLNMMSQPTFGSAVQQLPGNFDNVLQFDITDRYWLWGSDRADVSLFAEWQWMLNYGVGSIATTSGTALEGYGAGNGSTNFSNAGFYNVTSNNFVIGLDFAY